jgi:AraC family transcriptional regulator of adaptative response/methylated-DNA-[protein]-cysteine methyltransferase
MSRTSTAVATAVLADPRWAAVLARDAAADGTFFYAVKTTGVFCRPSCAARPARPENVSFHASAAAARAAGFRACQRCRPEEPALAERQAVQVAELCRFLAEVDEPPSLDALARRAGLSPYHLHRLFKRVTGQTPRAYAAAQRAERLRARLGQGARVTDAIYGAGYNSNGRFYAESHALLGMTAGRYRAGGDGQQIRFAVGACSLGAILVAATERGVCAIALGDDPEALVHDLERRFPRAQLLGADAAFEQLVARVVALVERPDAEHELLPLDVRGTAFQQRVWQALRAIPPGTTASYAQIAERLGQPRAVRAVAQACAANTLAVAIPCHRVVRSDGDPAGYRWGIARKRALLARERRA